MNFDSGTAYAESDADDEYERSVAASSPVMATDSEASPIDSELPSSNEHTPTTYGHRSSADRLPETIISEWTAEECADFISTIDLQQYADSFLGTLYPTRLAFFLLPSLFPYPCLQTLLAPRNNSTWTRLPTNHLQRTTSWERFSWHSNMTISNPWASPVSATA